MDDATFNPALPTDLDRMRDILGDVDLDNPMAPDVTYSARLQAASGNWKLAAAAMARSFASRAINNISSFSATGDMSISWNNRARDWLLLAEQLEAEVSADQGEALENSIWSTDVIRGDRNIRGEYSRPMRERKDPW